MIIFWQLLSILYFDLTLHCKKNVSKYPGKLNMTNGQILKNGRTSNQNLLWTEISNQWVSRYFRQWHMYSCLCLRPETCRSKTQVSSKFNILRMVRWCYGDDVTLKMCFLCCHVEDFPVMIGVEGRWGPVNVPWGGGVGTCSRSMWHANDCQCRYIDDVTTKLGVGAKHSFRSSSKSVRSDWIVHGCVPVALYLGKPWHITLQNTQLLPSGYYIYILIDGKTSNVLTYPSKVYSASTMNPPNYTHHKP